MTSDGSCPFVRGIAKDILFALTLNLRSFPTSTFWPFVVPSDEMTNTLYWLWSNSASILRVLITTSPFRRGILKDAKYGWRFEAKIRFFLTLRNVFLNTLSRSLVYPVRSFRTLFSDGERGLSPENNLMIPTAYLPI